MKLWKSLKISIGSKTDTKAYGHDLPHWGGQGYELDVFKSQTSLSTDSGLCTERGLRRTHIEITRPPGKRIGLKLAGGDTAEWYRDRKGTFSMNVQTVVDSKLKILDIVARWPGSCHDQTIFNNSRIKQRLVDREFGNNCILGDKGYENTNYLLTPLHNPQTPGEHLYNESQIRTRNVVERSYGVWKSRFPVLSKKITLNISKVQAIIVACAVLHNMATDMGDENFGYDNHSDDGDETFTSLVRDTSQNNNRYNKISYFTSLL